MKQNTFVYILIAAAVIAGAYIYVAPSITQPSLSSSSTVSYVTTIALDKTTYSAGDTVKISIKSTSPLKTNVPTILNYKITIPMPNVNTIIPATQTAYAAAQGPASSGYTGSYSFKIPIGAIYSITIGVTPIFSDGSWGQTVNRILTLKTTWS